MKFLHNLRFRHFIFALFFICFFMLQCVFLFNSSAYAVGSPVGTIEYKPWVDDVYTDESGDIWLKCDGQTFSAEDYPDLVGKSGVISSEVYAMPVMTSDTTPAPFRVEASNVGNPVFYAFDRSQGSSAYKGYPPVSSGNDCWGTIYKSFDKSGLGNVSLTITLDSPKSITKYSFRLRGKAMGDVGTLSTTPKSWSLQGSNDKLNWISVDSRSGQSGSSTLYTLYNFNLTSPSESYLYYRFIFTALNHSAGYETYLALGEVTLYCYSYSVSNISTNATGQFAYIKAFDAPEPEPTPTPTPTPTSTPTTEPEPTPGTTPLPDFEPLPQPTAYPRPSYNPENHFSDSDDALRAIVNNQVIMIDAIADLNESLNNSLLGFRYEVNNSFFYLYSLLGVLNSRSIDSMDNIDSSLQVLNSSVETLNINVSLLQDTLSSFKEESSNFSEFVSENSNLLIDFSQYSTSLFSFLASVLLGGFIVYLMYRILCYFIGF